MLYYGLLIAAAILFSTQFLFQQRYQNECGMDWSATLNFNIYTGIAGFFLMWIMGKGHLEFSWFSFAVAIAYSVVNIIYNYASLKSFDTVNLSAYSMFAMLGGMLLPFAYGIIWSGEDLTIPKVLCGGLIVVALLFTLTGGQSSGKAIWYYMAVFVMNGMCGVLSAFHQSHTDLAVDSNSFLAISRAITVVICLVMQMMALKKFPLISKKAGFYSIGFAILCGLGNLFALIGLTKLPASVQYPIITGGVIVFSTVVSIIQKERPSVKQLIAAGLALVATILIM